MALGFHAACEAAPEARRSLPGATAYFTDGPWRVTVSPLATAMQRWVLAGSGNS